MSLIDEFKNLPEKVILGLNYSGAHDTAIAIVSPSGEPIFAISLERITRIKQDGRPPNILLKDFPWEKVSKVAISVSEKYTKTSIRRSKFHPIGFEVPCDSDAAHGSRFYKNLNFIPVKKYFIPHHLSHAASSFWTSGFDEATCLVYDGGMFNEEWFGGVYGATNKSGIKLIDGFSADYDSNMTNLYAFVTAALGFTPVKHEGKVTGLAAYGKVNLACEKLLLSWLSNRDPINGLIHWENLYENLNVPYLSVNRNVSDFMRNAFKKFKIEDVAATLQFIAENHVLQLLENIRNAGLLSNNLCLSGGLFANVKINQKVNEQGFDNLFISPPMTDDGAALGAALQLASKEDEFLPRKIQTMCLGTSYEEENKTYESIFDKLIFINLGDSVSEVVDLLSKGEEVAIFQKAMEFGPRSLGNRSILVSASDFSVNQKLNEKLKRTEFMPFAPICLEEDRDDLFYNSESVKHAMKYMTVTLNCKERMKKLCPAVVHCDGTARPQLLNETDSPFLYNVISEFKRKTGVPALVNTSFNVHEEPIVCTVNDALKGFFESGLDNLYIDGYLIQLKNNKNIQLEYLKEISLRK